MSAVGTLLYIANHLSYKPRDDLIIYKKSELDSTFVEIINSKSQISLRLWMLKISIKTI